MKKLIALLPLVGLAVSIAGCPAFPDVCDYGACTDGGDASTDTSPNPDGTLADTGADAEPPPPGCDTPTEPLKNPEKCLVDAFGAFVSPTGDDGNDGTKAKPFKTIGKALGTTRSRIVVCEGTYGEALEVKRDVAIYSGVACSFGSVGAKAKIAPDAPTGMAVAASVALFDVEVIAKSATEAGGSSVGILAKPGSSLTLSRAAVVAGEGADGKDAETAGNNHFPTPDGNPALGSVGGVQKVCACPSYGTSTGAFGGNGGSGAVPAGQKGADGTSTPAAPTTGGATGTGGTGAPSGVGACAPGVPGSPGSSRLGGPGASLSGVVSGSGWVASAGAPGEAGNPGQGGGGGGGGFYVGSSSGGGGGGCGGCGGAPGKGGGSGGSSIAVLAVDSAVVASTTTFKTSKAGNGKQGGSAQEGGGGGSGGATGACSGARGGAGAGGGGGGGGAGGSSVGVAYTGTPPSLDGSSAGDAATHPSVTLGAAGERGTGGPGGDAVTGAIPPGAAGTTGGDGAPGIAKATAKVDKS